MVSLPCCFRKDGKWGVLMRCCSLISTHHSPRVASFVCMISDWGENEMRNIGYFFLERKKNAFVAT